MTDIQKDQAIYQAMLEIANNVFDVTMELNDGLQTALQEEGGFVTLSDICNKKKGTFCPFFRNLSGDNEVGSKQHTVEVDTFSCSFLGYQVFELLKYWKGLANVRGEQVFLYEKKLDNEFVGSVEVEIENSTSAKLLAKHTANDVTRPVMNYVYTEVNATRQTINFVASDGRTLGVISNDPSMIFAAEKEDTTFEAIFDVTDWKRICDFSKKNKHKVTFDIYKKKNIYSQSFDTFVVHLGDVMLRSRNDDYMTYPNWRSVIPKYDELIHRFSIVPEERKAAQDWIKNLGKNSYDKVCVSFYRGSDLMYFDYEDIDFGKCKSATFHLTRPSDVTIGVCYLTQYLQQIKFTGFNIEKGDRATILNCEETDIMLVMPVLKDSGYVYDVENREVVELCEDEQTAMVVELDVAA